MTDYESEQDVIAELVREFPTVPARIITNILHAYLETNDDLEHAAAGRSGSHRRRAAPRLTTARVVIAHDSSRHAGITSASSRSICSRSSATSAPSGLSTISSAPAASTARSPATTSSAVPATGTSSMPGIAP